MKYWKYLDIDATELALLHSKLKLIDSAFDSKSFQQPVDLGLTHFLNREVAQFILVQVQPNNIIGIHKDERPNDLCLSLNLPIENCENTITSFYTYNSEIPPEIKTTADNKQFKMYKPENCMKVSEYRLTSPVLLRTDVLHNVVNNNSTVRRALSVRFLQDPWDLMNSD